MTLPDGTLVVGCSWGNDTVATMKLGETMMYAATDLISAQEDAVDALRAEVERLREGLEVLGALSDVTYDQCSEYSPRAYGEGRIDALLTVQRIVRAALLPTSQPLKEGEDHAV